MDSTCCHTDRNTENVWNRRVAGVRELVYFIILLCFTTARCSDTRTDRRTVFCSVQNCKHPGEYIWADIYIYIYKKAHNIPREQPRLARLAFRIFALSYSDNKQSLNYIPWEYSASHSAASRVCRVWKDISWISVCSTFFFFFFLLWPFNSLSGGGRAPEPGCLLQYKSFSEHPRDGWALVWRVWHPEASRCSSAWCTLPSARGKPPLNKQGS